MKSFEAISRSRSLRNRRLSHRKNNLKERKSSRMKEKRKSLNHQKNKLKSLAVVNDIEVVFDRNWFAEEEVGRFGKLNKKPFVLILNIGADDTLAKQEVTAETLDRKALKLRTSFISVKKISTNDRLNIHKVEVDQDVEVERKLRASFVYLKKMHVNDTIEKNEVETDDEDSDIDDDMESENIEKLLDIRDKLRVKVKNHENRKIVQLGSEVYDSLKEYKTISLIIEKNSETEMV